MSASNFGHFDDANKEFVITTPYTPLPWINYLGNNGFYALISNTAGGYSFYRDPKFRRLTRYRYNNVPMDSGGRYFYFNLDGDIWSATGRPVDAKLDHYECRHGMGYSRFIAEKNQLRSELTSFVPLNTTAEVHRLQITNQGDSDKSFSLFSFIEWCLWNAEDDGTNFQRNLSTGEVEVESNTIFHKTEYRERRNHYAFYSVNREMQGFDTDRQHFIGTYNSFANPQAVQQGKSTNSVAHGWSPIASHQLDITLAPGESQSLIFVLGYVEVEESQKWQAQGIINKQPAWQLQNQFNTDAKFEQALSELNQYWANLLERIKVDTPSESFNRSVNIWNQYQNMVTFNLSRSASFYESGIGRGMGFRDSNQDTIGFTHMVPSAVRERIIDLAATQQSDGSAYHQYQPLTKKGNAAIGGNFNDDPMWLVLSTANYIKETGDANFLQQVVPFEDTPEVPNTLFDHLSASFNHVLNNLGPHGLPLIGRADWNDCLNLNCFSTEPNESYQTTQRGPSDVAESLMIAGQFVLYGKEYIELCKLQGKTELAASAQQAVDTMIATVDKHGWDGEWFLRAYDSRGLPIGSHKNDDGKIFIESQGFCVMAGIGLDDGRAQQALDSVNQHLLAEHGVVLQQPAFADYNKFYGEITSYPPGYKENAGIFTHNNPWIVVGETLLGRGDQSFDYFSRFTPLFRPQDMAKHKTEPYVYSQMIAGKDAAIPGEAKNSWLTGAAAWSFYTATQYILGIAPDYQGLRINPCIPADWSGFNFTRQYRGATYHIEVQNPHKVSKGIKQLIVDGNPIEGNLIPFDDYQGQHKVVVVMG
ncbi:GH36-type glycosyl hydrolase domain-containing protein [Neptunicella marina]|uniref:Glycosyl transferase n=1 Tax=Neptunicella marina TaxID=2125989 RepID=A0A8J6M1D8_9ALTE|nr:glycosyl hydrolase family 65 protein [Neptunicella marina]MBC3765367.1 glycosyl transferase [Neptunicella marina]